MTFGKSRLTLYTQKPEFSKKLEEEGVTREVILATRITPLFTHISFILYCMFVLIQFGCCGKTTTHLSPK